MGTGMRLVPESRDVPVAADEEAPVADPFPDERIVDVVLMRCLFLGPPDDLGVEPDEVLGCGLADARVDAHDDQLAAVGDAHGPGGQIGVAPGHASRRIRQPLELESWLRHDRRAPDDHGLRLDGPALPSPCRWMRLLEERDVRLERRQVMPGLSWVRLKLKTKPRFQLTTRMTAPMLVLVRMRSNPS
jgi:hypothetical protein